MSAETQSPLPVVEFVKIPKDGEPYLEGHKCKACSAVFLGERDVCGKCGARKTLDRVKLSNRGQLYVYSIVHRSFPGVEVPYISAIVDLEGGGTVKGNLINIKADPSAIKMGMPVRVVFKDALGRKDKQGNSYLSYFFEPA
jgi:uncharacterized OB-fold protein